MSIVKKIRENIFITVLILAYIVSFILNPSIVSGALKSSIFFFREMLMIMPVVFILTALLDVWVPKEKITKYLGKGAGIKGIFFSFVLGSISAGPIYAAFPICVMLYKKGASVQNLVIILSGWAVIKIPMLINEVKFLGSRFMIIRWILTITSIIIFSWLTAKIVKRDEIEVSIDQTKGLKINSSACIGCGLCAKIYPERFALDKDKGRITDYSLEDLDMQKLNEAIKSCPVNAISFYKE